MSKIVGIVFNPYAGKREIFPIVGELLVRCFSAAGFRFVAGEGPFGGDHLPGKIRIIPLPKELPKALKQAAETFVLLRVKVVVGVGGDGTLNYLASRLLELGASTAIMGVAAGTANVGPLIRFNLERLRRFDPTKCHIHTVTPLEVCLGGNFLGYAFVDAVIGNTFLGVREGGLEAFSARCFLQKGTKEPLRPSRDLGQFIVQHGANVFEVNHVAQVIASSLHHTRFYIGKAITGPLCWAYFLGATGAIIFSSVPIVDPYITLASYQETEPVELKIVVFAPGEQVEVRGSSPDAFVILDGNPMVALGNEPLVVALTNRMVRVISPRPEEEDCYPIGFEL